MQCEVKAGWLEKTKPHTRIFFKTAKKLQRYIFGCLILFTEVHIRPGCCNVRYRQLATCPSFHHPLSQLHILNLVVAMLASYQLMVVAKAQHKHHSTVYDHHDCMRLLKVCCLKSVTLILQQKGGEDMVIIHIKMKVPSHVDLCYFNRPIIKQILWIFSHYYHTSLS